MILILCPLKIELEEIARHFKKNGFLCVEHHSPETGKYYIYNDLFLLAIGGLGKVEMALHTQHYIQTHQNIHLVICAGTAGSLIESVQIGSTVISTKTLEYDFKPHIVTSQIPSFKTSEHWIHLLKSTSLAIDTHFGPIASGDEDIADNHKKQTLQHNTQALAVAWEGAGAARAARFYKKDFLEIRGISDNATNMTRESFKQQIPQALLGVYQILNIIVSQQKTTQ